MTEEWQIAPLDTLFFRGPEPFSAGESVYLRSRFPPWPQSCQGLVRSALLEAYCVDLGRYSRGGCGHCAAVETCQVRTVVGEASGKVGTLDLRGPYILRTSAKETTRVYPAPADLRIAPGEQVVRLSPGPPVLCDAGNVCLPAASAGAPYALRDLRAVDWITEDGLMQYRMGGLPPSSTLADAGELWDWEPRVGLARDPTTRGAREGMLYSIESVRLRDGVKLGLRVGGTDTLGAAAPGISRLGGEGRLVEVTPATVGSQPTGDVLATIGETRRLRLLLLTPADFGGRWLPEGFERMRGASGGDSWRGTLRGAQLRVVASCGGRMVSVGGWDLAANRPKPLRWCVAAGTVYYCVLDDGVAEAAVVKALDDQKLGDGAQLGFGWAALGAWTEPFEKGAIS